jgi:hypothetical protein
MGRISSDESHNRNQGLDPEAIQRSSCTGEVNLASGNRESHDEIWNPDALK